MKGTSLDNPILDPLGATPLLFWLQEQEPSQPPPTPQAGASSELGIVLCVVAVVFCVGSWWRLFRKAAKSQ